MTPDTAALRALADATTPGPWEAVWNDDLGEYTVYSHADDGFEEVCTITPDVPPEAHYIAALDPDTVRALCDAADDVERLERWKREALAVLADWETVWHELGEPGPLGASKATSSLAAVRDLRTGLAQLRQDVADLCQQERIP